MSQCCDSVLSDLAPVYLDDCGEFYLGLMAAKWVLMILTHRLLKYTREVSTKLENLNLNKLYILFTHGPISSQEKQFLKCQNINIQNHFIYSSLSHEEAVAYDVIPSSETLLYSSSIPSQFSHITHLIQYVDPKCSS